MAVKPSSKVEAQRALRIQRVATSADPAAPARSRAIAIRAGLESFVATRRLIAAAFQDQDWISLGYTSWEAYCDAEFSLKSMRLTAEERNEAILAFASVGMTTREIGAATGTSKDTAQRALKAARVSRETKSPLVEALRGEIAAVEAAQDSATAIAETPPDPLEAGLVEPAGTDQAAVLAGTQTAAEGNHSPDADAAEAPQPRADDAAARARGGEEDTAAAGRVSPNSPAVVPSGGVSNVLRQPGSTTEERIEGEAASLAVDTPSADLMPQHPTAPTSPTDAPQQPGHISVGSDGGPRLDSPTGRDPEDSRSDDVAGDGSAAVATPGRSEIQLHGGGEAPATGIAVEPVLEGDDAAMTSPSSDPEDHIEERPFDRLVAALHTAVDLMADLDPEALAGYLFENEVADLVQDAADISDFVERLERARTTGGHA